MFKSVKKAIEKLQILIEKKRDVELMIEEINDKICEAKVVAIYNQLKKTDKNILIKKLLILMLQDDNDIDYYYKKVQQHNSTMIQG